MTESSYTRYNKSYYERHRQERNDYSREYMRKIYYPAHRIEVMARVRAWRKKQKEKKLHDKPENKQKCAQNNKNRGKAKG